MIEREWWEARLMVGSYVGLLSIATSIIKVCPIEGEKRSKTIYMNKTVGADTPQCFYIQTDAINYHLSPS
jgi:hypothetical protein